MVLVNTVCYFLLWGSVLQGGESREPGSDVSDVGRSGTEGLRTWKNMSKSV